MAPWGRYLSHELKDLTSSSKELGVLYICHAGIEEAEASSGLEPLWTATLERGAGSRAHGRRTSAGNQRYRVMDGRHALFWIMPSPLSEGQAEPTHGLSGVSR